MPLAEGNYRNIHLQLPLLKLTDFGILIENDTVNGIVSDWNKK